MNGPGTASNTPVGHLNGWRGCLFFRGVLGQGEGTKWLQNQQGGADHGDQLSSACAGVRSWKETRADRHVCPMGSAYPIID